MKKLNKKGITLVELIVSFALIAVAVTYFYQTLLTVNKLYKTSTDETNDFVDKTYVLRILDACIKKSSCSTDIYGNLLSESEFLDKLNDYDSSLTDVKITPKGSYILFEIKKQKIDGTTLTYTYTY